jgi:hypothetical protein
MTGIFYLRLLRPAIRPKRVRVRSGATDQCVGDRRVAQQPTQGNASLSLYRAWLYYRDDCQRYSRELAVAGMKQQQI